MSGLKPGLMDREIVLQTAAKSQDPETGEEVLTFTDETLWAQWLPAGSKEAWQAQQRLGSFVEGVFRIYDRTPRPSAAGDRIVWDGRTFDIKPYVEIGRGEGLDLPVVGTDEL